MCGSGKCAGGASLPLVGADNLCRDVGGEGRELEIVLSGPEVSDSLVFVLKDGNAWYDSRGDNFEVRLSPLLAHHCLHCGTIWQRQV